MLEERLHYGNCGIQSYLYYGYKMDISASADLILRFVWFAMLSKYNKEFPFKQWQLLKTVGNSALAPIFQHVDLYAGMIPFATTKATCWLILDDHCSCLAKQKAFVLLPLGHFTQIYGKEKLDYRCQVPFPLIQASIAYIWMDRITTGHHPTNRAPWVTAQSQRQDTGLLRGSQGGVTPSCLYI